jgi:hypothetical protein
VHVCVLLNEREDFIDSCLHLCDGERETLYLSLYVYEYISSLISGVCQEYR